MTDLEFKQQVLDTKSASFCAAKWYNATIWLGSGQTTSCHHPPAHSIDKDKVSIDPRLLHNTPQKKDDRAKMIAGERPAGCEYCWKIEDMGRDAISDRVYKSKIYPIEALDEAYKNPPDSDVNLRTLEIAFDRTCQFVKTLLAHRTGILNWFDYRISTGPLEGFNNKIKVLKRKAYGYRDMEYFGLKIYALHENRYGLL